MNPQPQPNPAPAYQLVFQLKQHTPILHFQHDQTGATLRATELKPKLDLYIMRKLLLSIGEAALPDHAVREKFKEMAKGKMKEAWLPWLVARGENEQVALQYKVHVRAKSVDKTLVALKDPVTMYFGNMGDDYPKKPICKSTAVEPSIVFNAMHTGLIDLLREHFPAFLLRTNFGTRQNKGYGAFFLKDIDPDSVAKTAASVACLKFDVQADVQEAQRQVFKVINYYFARLKSGINYGTETSAFKEYKPSFLRDYLLQNHPFQWEKKWMKERFFPLSSNTPEARFARPFLGLYPAVKFLKAKKHGELPNREISIDVTCVDGTIARIKSPLTFKPMLEGTKARVYVFIEDVDWTPVLNKEFAFDAGNKTCTIPTPPSAIDLHRLLAAYHAHLGPTFNATEFTGKPIKVTL